MHDLSCVIHLHSLFSDGTGTVEEIARAAEGIDVVLLTDHDTMEARPGWYGDVLVLVGEEVSPGRGNHYLAFGLDEALDKHDHNCADHPMGTANAEWSGWLAHSSLWSGLERDGRLVRA